MNKFMTDKEEVLHEISKLYQEVVDSEVWTGRIRTTFGNNFSDVCKEITLIVRLK